MTIRKGILQTKTAFLAVAAVLLVELVGGAFWFFRHSIMERYILGFESDAEERISIVSSVFRERLEDLESLRRFFIASGVVDRKAFDTFTATREGPFLNGIQAVEWIPVVTMAERGTYEDQARRDGLNGFTFTEKSPDGRIVPASARAVYYPVYYLHPYADNERAAGYDLGSDATRLALLERARDTGLPAVSGRLKLVQAGDQEWGVIAALPVYGSMTPPETPEARRSSVKGFVVGVFTVRAMFAVAISPTRPVGLPVLLEDLSAPEGERFLLYWKPRLGGDLLKDVSDSKPTLGREIRLLDRRWHLTVYPGRFYTAANLNRTYWLMVPVGLLLIVLTLLYLNAAYSRVRAADENRKFLQSTIDALHSHICVLDDKGKILAVNRAWRGFGEENAPIASMGSFLVPNSFEGVNYLEVCDSASGEGSEQAQEFGRGIRDVISGTRPMFRLEYPCHAPHRKRWFSGRVTRFEGEGIAKAVVSHSDITEQKLSDERVRENERLLKTFLNAIPESAYLVDRNGIALAANAKVLERFGCTQEQFIGTDPFTLLRESGVAVDRRQRLNEAFETGRAVHFEDRRNGRIINNYFTPVPDEDGRARWVAVLGIDVTAYKTLEAELRKKSEDLEKRIREIACLYGISHIVEVDGADLPRILQDSANLLPKSLSDPDCAGARIVLDGNEYRSHGCKEGACADMSGEIRIDGVQRGFVQVGYKSQQPVRVNGPFLPEEKALLDAVTERIGRIVERIESEAARAALVRELEAKNRELEGLIYMASHDLRTPLVNVIGFTQRLQKLLGDINGILAEKGVPDELSAALKPILSERVPSSLNHIRNSGEKMDMLINGLLRISRVGRLVVHSERVDMNAMLKSVASTMAFQAQKLRAEISIGDLPPCMGDHAQLSQVFSNLMDNALKYCEPSRSPRIEVSASVDGRMVTYKIADNGKGMKEEDLSRAFEIFKRLEGSEGVPGEGLGLAIVKRIVEKHGGKIWVESEPGVGSTFFVELQTA